LRDAVIRMRRGVSHRRFSIPGIKTAKAIHHFSQLVAVQSSSWMMATNVIGV
jgi:hypothetical protein